MTHDFQSTCGIVFLAVRVGVIELPSSNFDLALATYTQLLTVMYRGIGSLRPAVQDWIKVKSIMKLGRIYDRALLYFGLPHMKPTP
jgi:hypothetical protein